MANPLTYPTDRPMTVLQLLPALESGGVERGTLEVGKELVARGHRSMVISAGGRLVDQLVAEGSEHICWQIGKKSPFTLKYVRPLQKLFRDEQIDLVHVRSRVPAWVCNIAWRWLKPQHRPRLVSTCHGLYSPGFYSSVMTRGERVISISDTVTRYLLEHYPKLSPLSITRIYRGIDPAEFPYGYKPTESWVRQWESDFPIAKGRPLVTLPGRMTRYKGHTEFVELISRLRREIPDVCGVIAGGEDPKRQKYAAHIRGLIAAAGLENHIVFTGHRTDLRDILAMSNVVVSLSSQPPEAFGRTSLEAVSLGRPLVAFESSGPAEILDRLLPEGIVEAGNIKQATDRVLRFIQDPPEVKRNTFFTKQEMLSQTLQVYYDLTGCRQNAATKLRAAA